MLEHVFGSTTRARLLVFFFSHPVQAFFTREITRKIRGHLTAVRRELQNLTKLGVLNQRGVGRKKYYQVNLQFVLFDELKRLLFKAQVMLELNLIKQLRSLGALYSVVLTGFFVSDDTAQTDILVVGSLNRRKFRQLMLGLQTQLDHPIRYTLMTKREFFFRNDLADRFLYDILEGRKIIVFDPRHFIT